MGILCECALLKFYDGDKRGVLDRLKEQRGYTEDEGIAIIQSEYNKVSYDKRISLIEDKLCDDTMRRFDEKKLSCGTDKRISLIASFQNLNN